MSKSLTLSGPHISLELLNSKHSLELEEIVSHEALCFHEQTFIPTPELMPIYIKLSQNANKKGREIPFAIVDKASHKILGSIKLENFHDKSAEIGSTFIALDKQGTGVNTEAKFILLQHAFQVLELSHVDVIVHKKNLISQRSLENLGFKKNSSFSHLKTMPQWENDEYISYIAFVRDWYFIKKKLQSLLAAQDFSEF